jgi:phosphatidate cytidylyltransferase
LAAGVPASSLAGAAGAAAGFGLGLTLMAGVCLAGGGEPAERLERLQRRGWGLLYVGGLLACLLLILGLANGRLLVLFLLASVVFADTGAYFSGRFWGRRKMAPQLSPGKTVEGLVGGLAAASAAGALFAWLVMDDTGPGAGALLGLAMAAFSVLGDLLESVIKRSAGVKDSGGVLPGHGGLLDRVDGIILAGPPLLLARLLWWP